jgi:hypothetical protein
MEVKVKELNADRKTYAEGQKAKEAELAAAAAVAYAATAAAAAEEQQAGAGGGGDQLVDVKQVMGEAGELLCELRLAFGSLHYKWFKTRFLMS